MTDAATSEEFDSILTYLSALSQRLGENERQRVAGPLADLLRLRQSRERPREVGGASRRAEHRSWRVD